MKRGFVRIIAGKWRGRNLQVMSEQNVRPTPDRVRETLFNWLNPLLPGADCLDLFAGSGALGFESLSRGAGFVHFIDQSPKVVASLRATLTRFGVNNARVSHGSVPEVLKKIPTPVDIVFLDPPYEKNLLTLCCDYLETQNLLKNPAYIYLEGRSTIEDNKLPLHWEIVKCKKAGQVVFYLAKRMITK